MDKAIHQYKDTLEEKREGPSQNTIVIKQETWFSSIRPWVNAKFKYC